MLGSLKLPLRGKKYYTLYGGPYNDRPSNMFGVKMASEINRPCDVNIPTADYETPDRKQLTAGLEATVDAILKGKAVYVGCMGGRGRTGLFLAVVAKAFQVRSPIPYVRK